MFSIIINLIKKICSFFSDINIEDNLEIKQETPLDTDLKTTEETKPEQQKKQIEELVPEDTPVDDTEIKTEEDLKRKKARKSKKPKPAKRQRSLFELLILFITVFVIFIFSFGLLLNMTFGNEVRLSAHLTYSPSLKSYEIQYDFETDLNNIYYNTKVGDKLRLNEMVLNTSNDSFKITEINKDGGYFVTSLPRTYSTTFYSLEKYEANLKSTHGRVILTLKIGFGKTQIIKSEPCF